MLGSKPVTVTRKPHQSATTTVESFTVKGFGRECFGIQRWETVYDHEKRFFWMNGSNRRDNRYDNLPSYNSFVVSPLYRGSLTMQYRLNTSGWFSFGIKDTDGEPLLYSFRPNAVVSATYRDDKGTLCVWEGTIEDFFQS